jgi:hypothetical protein
MSAPCLRQLSRTLQNTRHERSVLDNQPGPAEVLNERLVNRRRHTMFVGSRRADRAGDTDQGELTDVRRHLVGADSTSMVSSIASGSDSVGPQIVDEVVPADAGESIRGTASPGDGVRAAPDILHAWPRRKGVKVGILIAAPGHARLVREVA